MEISIGLTIRFIVLTDQVSIWVGTVTTTIHITIDVGIDTYGITAIDGTRHVVTAIDIMHISTTYQRTGRQFVGEVIAWQVRTRRIFAVHRWLHVCHTATAIQVINDKAGVVLDFKQQTRRRGHSTTVTTAIEVTHLTRQQVPRRTDVHLSLVVATKEAAYLIGTTAGLREGGVDTHLLEAGVGEQVDGTCRAFGNLHTSSIGPDMVHHRTGVIDVDDCLFLYRSIVTTTVGIDNRATQHLQIGTVLFWVYERCCTPCNDNTSLLGDIVVTVSQRASVIIQIGVVTVTTAKELSDIYLLGINRRLDVCSAFAISGSIRVRRSSLNFCFSIIIRSISSLAKSRIAFVRCSYFRCSV